MKLEFTHEFKLRYMGGLFRFQEHSRAEKHWAKFQDFYYDMSDVPNSDMKGRMKMNVKVWNDKEKKWALSKIDIGAVILDFSFPDVGYINMERGTRYLERLPYRQWNRLLRSSVVAAETYSGNVEDLNPSEMGSGWEEKMLEILYGKYPTFTEAVESLTSGERVATAFAKDYAVTIAPQDKKKMWILLKNGPIGVVDKVEGNYIVAVPPSMEYVIEDLMQYADTACYF